MIDPRTYGNILRQAGFADVDSQDRTWQYCTLSKRELNTLIARKSEFVAEFGEEDHADICRVFNDKLDMCLRGDRSFVVVHARKGDHWQARSDLCQQRTQC